MIEVNDKAQCCGCSACISVCPHDAITMRPDGLGFMYPYVDRDLCVACGLCDAVCDFAFRMKKNHAADALEVHAVRHKDRSVLSASQSGGAFTALSDVVLNKGGVIYGAVFGERYEVIHARAEDAEKRNRMRGSKYVQSDMKDTFRRVKEDLKAGYPVMFVGTPCQTAGLKSYLPDSLHESLLLVDFICHGVPSPAIWKAYLDVLGAKGEIVRADFRDKSVDGWKIHKESFQYKDGESIIRETFKVLFYKNIMLRPSCGSCTYDVFNRASDIMVADFWGVSEVIPQMDGPEGTSMVVCLTEKGRNLFETAMDNLESLKANVSASALASFNPNLLSHTRRHPESELFAEAFVEKGFPYVARRWGDRGWRYKVWQLKCILRKFRGK